MAAKKKSNSTSRNKVIALLVFLVVLVVVLYTSLILRDYKIVAGDGIIPQLEAKYSVPVAYNFSINNQVPEKLSLKAAMPTGTDAIEYRVSRFKNMFFAHTYKTANGMKELGMLSGGKQYYVQARAYKKNLKGRSVHGKWSATKSNIVKKKPKK